MSNPVYSIQRYLQMCLRWKKLSKTAHWNVCSSAYLTWSLWGASLNQQLNFMFASASTYIFPATANKWRRRVFYDLPAIQYWVSTWRMSIAATQQQRGDEWPSQFIAPPPGVDGSVRYPLLSYSEVITYQHIRIFRHALCVFRIRWSRSRRKTILVIYIV